MTEFGRMPGGEPDEGDPRAEVSFDSGESAQPPVVLPAETAEETTLPIRVPGAHVEGFGSPTFTSALGETSLRGAETAPGAAGQGGKTKRFAERPD